MSHDDDALYHQGLRADLTTLVARRRVLSILGGGGLALLAACSSGGSGTTVGDTVDSSRATGTTGTAGSTGGTVGTDGSPTVPNSEPTPQPITGSTDAASAPTDPSTSATAPVECDAIPGETAGPFPGDGTNGPNLLSDSGVVRRDIRSSIGTASGTADGMELQVELTLIDTGSGSSCASFAGAAVYLWHCTIDGRYSMYDIEGENFLRGVQVADAQGKVRFTTIFPGCYPGRWPHMHFEVYRDASSVTSGDNSIAVSQLALDGETCAAVYATSGYEDSARSLSRLAIERDGVFRDDGAVDQLATVSGTAGTSGFTAALTVPV